MIDAGKQIKSICYVENFSQNFKPYLVMITNDQIELLSFKKKEYSNPDLKSEINKLNYHLYHLVPDQSEYKPINLDLGEVVTNVV